MRNRNCIVINLRSAIAIVLIFICNGIHQSETATGNQMDIDNIKNESLKSNISDNESNISIIEKSPIEANISCTGYEEEQCAKLESTCISCAYNYSCIYGRDLNVSCTAHAYVQCLGERSFQRQMNCRYCYQTEKWQQTCSLRGNCKLMSEPHYRTNCTVHSNVLCLGTRFFQRNMRCNWTQGYRWSTALIISLTLGGFGADRFYLGHWQEGIGKLFSFGGLGVWTIIDVLLISLHYLGPADGSLYI